MGGDYIQRGDEYWSQNDRGYWFKWNPSTGSWDHSPTPPPPDPSAAPPPPVPVPPHESQTARPLSSTPTIVAADPPKRGLSIADLRYNAPLQIGVAAALVVVLLVAAYVLTSGGAEGPVTPPVADLPGGSDVAPAAAPEEATVYDQLSSMQNCFDLETLSVNGQPGLGPRPGLRDDISRISRVVADIRHLNWRRRVATRIVPRTEIGKLAAKRAEVGLTSEDTQIEESILTALGLIPRNTDLAELSQDAIESQIAGFYIPGKEKLFAGSVQGELKLLDEVILAHELGHALVDQTIGLPKIFEDRDPSQGDADLATLSLIEGDATLLMTNYAVVAFGPAEAVKMAGDPSVAASVEEAKKIPYFFRRSLEFPYNEGLLFNCSLFALGQWQRIDEAYMDPPVSSAQILFPGRYLSETEPTEPATPTDPEGWAHEWRSSFGAAELLWMLQSPDAANDSDYDPATGLDRVRGWQGGAIDAWTQDQDVAFLVSLVDGGVGGAQTDYRLCSELKQWHHEAFPEATESSEGTITVWDRGDDAAALNCEAQAPRFGVAPSQDVAMDLVSS